MTDHLRMCRALDRMVEGVMGGWADAEPEGHPRGPQPARMTKNLRTGRPPLLTDGQRAEIAASREPIPVLMERYSVSRSTITRARRVKTPAATSEL